MSVLRETPMYKAVTRGISVAVTPRYMPEKSSPQEERYFFAYTVEIINTGTERVQLRSRHWKIIDDWGNGQEVRGPGVVGEQPILGPGRKLQLHERVPAANPQRNHAGLLRDGDRERPHVHSGLRFFSRYPTGKAPGALRF